MSDQAQPLEIEQLRNEYNELCRRIGEHTYIAWTMQAQVADLNRRAAALVPPQEKGDGK